MTPVTEEGIMKAKGTAIGRRVVATVSAMVATLFAGSIPAFAYRLDDDSVARPAKAVPGLVAETARSGNSWAIALIVAIGVVAVAAALIGTVRIHRVRTRAVAAGF
jgi:hypothetical protein